MASKPGRRQERIEWLVRWAEKHDGVLSLSSRVLGDAFCQAFPEALRRQQPKWWGFQPTPMLTEDARAAYRAGQFQRRVIVPLGADLGGSLGFPHWSIDYWLYKQPFTGKGCITE